MHVGGLALFTPPGATAAEVRELFDTAVADDQVSTLSPYAARCSVTSSANRVGLMLSEQKVNLRHHSRSGGGCPGGHGEPLGGRATFLVLLDPADSPTKHAEAVDHRGVRVGAHESVGVGERAVRRLPCEHHAGRVFEVDLMADAGIKRHDQKIVEGMLRPPQQVVALLVAGELQDRR